MLLIIVHLDVCGVGICQSSLVRPTQDVVEVCDVKLRKVRLLGIEEVDSPDDTSTDLSHRGPGEDWPPELQTVQGAERIAFVQPFNLSIRKSRQAFHVLNLTFDESVCQHHGRTCQAEWGRKKVVASY